jgi:hypothetical protein
MQRRPTHPVSGHANPAKYAAPSSMTMPFISTKFELTEIEHFWTPPSEKTYMPCTPEEAAAVSM